MAYVVRLCSFEAVSLGRGTRRMPYPEFRAAVLKAGRFSVFEATETNDRARLFDRLARDETVFLDNSCGFPWTRVRDRRFA